LFCFLLFVCLMVVVVPKWGAAPIWSYVEKYAQSLPIVAAQGTPQTWFGSGTRADNRWG
jgi:hypothetical protein